MLLLSHNNSPSPGHRTEKPLLFLTKSLWKLRSSNGLPWTPPASSAESCQCGTGHSPPGVLVQLVEHRVVAVFEDQMQLPLPPEDFQQVHQVGVFQLL